MNAPLASPGPAPDFHARFTADEFLEMVAVGAFEGMKVELLDGELERMTPPMSEHGRIQLEIAFVLRLAVQTGPLRVYGEIGIRLGGHTVVAADAAIARPRDDANRMLDADEIVLAVEVANATLSRDLGAKRIAYATAGIPHYWVVDVEGRLIHRFGEPTGGDYRRLPAIRFGEAMPVPGTDRTISLD
jgi:Uma2 family endonuclease